MKTTGNKFVVTLDYLIYDWLIADVLLVEHFSVVIDNAINKLTDQATVVSSLNMICCPVHSTSAFQRYIFTGELCRRPIAFILDDRIKLHAGNSIGLKKTAEIPSSDPEFFTKLKRIMYLMHKVEFGKSCELKSSNS
jgi:hypothetical protein